MDRDFVRIDPHPEFGMRQTFGGLNWNEYGFEPNREKQKRRSIIEATKRIPGMRIQWIQISDRVL